MKTDRILKLPIFVTSLFVIVSCADWNSTPVTVDEHHGMAVRHMIANQTLYPEHGQEIRQELHTDGAKGEGVIRAYRAPATDLRKGKQGLLYGINSNSKTD